MTHEPRPTTSADIAAKIKDAEADIVRLSEGRNALALACVDGVEGSEAKYSEATVSLAQASQHLETLKAALAGAKQREQESRERDFARLNAMQINALKAHVDKRGHHARELSLALETAAEHWRLLINHTEKAHGLAEQLRFSGKIGMADWNLDWLRKMVASELYRVSGVPSDKGHSLPGAQHIHVNVEWNPEGSPKLVDEITKQCDGARRVLKPEIPPRKEKSPSELAV